MKLGLGTQRGETQIGTQDRELGTQVREHNRRQSNGGIKGKARNNNRKEELKTNSEQSREKENGDVKPGLVIIVDFQDTWPGTAGNLRELENLKLELSHTKVEKVDSGREVDSAREAEE